MEKEFFMVASHAQKNFKEDSIFKVSKEAKEREKAIGKEKVINSSIGALHDDEGNLLVLPTVVKLIREMDEDNLAAYAPIGGLKEYIDAAIKSTFRSEKPNGYIEGVATPGGTGAVRSAIWNYTEFNETILVPDWYWGPYRIIAEENRRKVKTFNLFTENFEFDINSFKKNMEELIKLQNRAFVILNFPSNNPTGYSLTDNEWDEIVDIIKEFSENKTSKITVLLDLAYLEYAEGTNRSFFKKFENLPQNIMVLMAFSMSKGYTLYGMRGGAILCLTSSEGAAKEFKGANELSSRATWSNCTRVSMAVLAKIFNDENLLKTVDSERNEVKEMLLKRGHSFVEEAKNKGIPMFPYRGGFFITLPINNANAFAEKLKENNVFAIPFMDRGIRVGICSISEEKCMMIPSIIKKIL